jgi:hypothetical protein
VEEFADVIIKNGKNSIEGIMIDITQKEADEAIKRSRICRSS